MADLQRIRVALSGVIGLPGVATFYAASTDTTAIAGLSTFFSAIKSMFPNGTTWQIPGSGDLINEVNGQLTGTWTQSGASSQVSAATASAWAAGVGARVRWLTNGIVHGRHTVGSTFLVPLLALHYQTNGTILDSSVTTIQTAADTLVSTTNMGVYSPRYVNKGGDDTIPSRDGQFFTVQAAQVPDQVTSLRSRRV